MHKTLKVLRQNRVMKNMFSDEAENMYVPLPSGLGRLLDDGLILRDGCLLLTSLLECASSVERRYFPDETGYECFVNKIHIDDYVVEKQLLTGMSFLHALSLRCADMKGTLPVRGILSTSEDGTIVRFHQHRPSQCWLDDDLDHYTEEGVLEVALCHPD